LSVENHLPTLKNSFPTNFENNVWEMSSQVDQTFVSAVADRRNQIPRKSLDYQTPLEVFLSHINESDLSSLY